MSVTLVFNVFFVLYLFGLFVYDPKECLAWFKTKSTSNYELMGWFIYLVGIAPFVGVLPGILFMIGWGLLGWGALKLWNTLSRKYA